MKLFKSKKKFFIICVALIIILSATFIIYNQINLSAHVKYEDKFMLHLKFLEQTKKENQIFYNNIKKEVESTHHNFFDVSLNDYDTSIAIDIHKFNADKNTILQYIKDEKSKQEVNEKFSSLITLKVNINNKIINAQTAKTQAEEAQRQAEAQQKANVIQQEKTTQEEKTGGGNNQSSTPPASATPSPQIPEWENGCDNAGCWTIEGWQPA